MEGLAQRIVEGDVPAPLLDKRVLQLDVGSLVAGTMYRGQFEERLKRVIDELKSSGAILFIDEVHMLVGAGAAGSSVDAANILKPALSRGELQVIGATTLEEYRKHIESDAALERRFQPIVVNEPSIDETIEILKGIRLAYEEHHRLTISDEALEAAARFSARYVTERFLPDKAIDLIDESSSRVRMYKSSQAKSMKQLVKDLREARQNHNLAVEDGRHDDAQELLEHQQGLEAQLERLRTGWDRSTSPVVSADDIAEVVSMWTGVPVMQMAQEESQRLLHMEDELKNWIIGQDEAIEMIAKSVRRARSGLKDPRRPIGSFIFLGPTGVGKTELTKALARFLFAAKMRWCSWICPILWSATVSAAWWGRLRDTWVMKKPDSSPRPSAAGPIPLWSSMKLRRPIPKRTTCCCKSWKKATSRMPKATRWTSATRSLS